MNNLKDLHIEKELLPLFDYSMNMFAKQKILNILQRPLTTTKDIMYRQHILKGFAENQHILKDYSYTILYLNEVHFFLSNDKIEVQVIGFKTGKNTLYQQIQSIDIIFSSFRIKVFYTIKP